MTIYTVGYQRLPIKRLVELMDCLEVDLLVDVRKKPYSQIQGYAAGALVERFGERYTMKGNVLGGGGNTTDEGLNWLREVSADKTVMLMCMEDFPMDCHRHAAICAPHFPDAVHFWDSHLYTASDMQKAANEEGECEAVGEIEFD